MPLVRTYEEDDGLDPLRAIAKRKIERIVEWEVELVFRHFDSLMGLVVRHGFTATAEWTQREMLKAPREPAWFVALYEEAKP